LKVNHDNRVQGAQLEKTAALHTGLEVTPGSGCGLRFKGDLNNECWLVEVKSTRDKTLVFDSRWWSKAEKQAKEKQKANVGLVFGWTTRPKGYTGELMFGAIQEPEKSSKFQTTQSVFPPVWALAMNKSKTKKLPNNYMDQLTKDVCGAIVLPNGLIIRIMPIDLFAHYVQNNSN